MTDKIRSKGRPRGQGAGISLYREIADRIASQIRDGVYPVGASLPPEAELATSFSVGRQTIRDAVRMLVLDGLVLRRPGDRTRVIATARQRTFSQTIASFDQWFNFPSAAVRRIVSSANITADEALTRTIHCQFGAALFRLRTIRSVQEEFPLAMMDIYMPPRFAGITKLPDHTEAPIHEQIERLYGELIQDVDVEMIAAISNDEHQELLRVRPGTPVMISVRRFFSATREPLLVTVSTYPNDRSVCKMHYKREAI
ncbi:GntR family transcriptional regulator [Ensifer adhaerens]|uniref:GntR family transcriptional regulator n=1 Tax=Ensifer adhaerens TaxID=106592 RepID=A0A9Q8YGS8_ENSAD|nr:GntR family transcriptional regulator [Ensifer adhaerens]USJ28428.1 GntR family transcriptional regulator [Ensifer adhaerens]